ncbi:glycine betaine/proline transport system substrate-binding protein [Tranquillimonas rosea]|uniref:Glycine betaine/proline transport system substrate-binding protein n=1 Tax=Tranquillimonas rosea TaxID=641238 RepID=A0A1H9WUA0_9RHOB|nr:ABC transporter substrate-binding protein [Tranquillimonas rosea]SES37371.1 glycine betaine/proline transport system substrate-binding protein [Tranquillimonas rosea]
MPNSDRLKCTRSPLAASLAVLALAMPAVAQDYPESDRPIRMTINDWTGQELTTRLMGGVLEEMGYTVEYVQADYLAQFTGLESGDLTVGMEIWETTGKDALEAAVETGNVVALGETGMEAIEEWWYPTYVKEECPGLPDWEALNECAEMFASPMTSPNGRYLGGPVTWGGFDEERVEALGLDFDVVHAGTDAALMAEVRSAIQREEPIIAWVYAPHWAPIQYDGEWVEFPEYTDACYEDPSWGPNPDMTHDCGKPRGWIKPAAWAGGRDVWPAAYTAIENFTIDNEQMGRLIGQVDVDGMPIQAAVDQWLQENEDTWQSWIPQN